MSLKQLYFNTTTIWEQVTKNVVFVKDENKNLVIDEKSATEVGKMIKNDLSIYNAADYVPVNDNDWGVLGPMTIAENITVTAVWKWYKDPGQIANAWFRIDHQFSPESTTCKAIPSRKENSEGIDHIITHSSISTYTANCPIATVSINSVTAARDRNSRAIAPYQWYTIGEERNSSKDFASMVSNRILFYLFCMV